MKAVRMHQHGGVEVLTYEEAPEPRIASGEVLVAVKACALNHLDVWVREGARGTVPMPHTLGSDVSGVVEEVGQGVSGIQKGMNVVISPGLSCGTCKSCLSGRDNQCPSYTILGQRLDGGYAQYVKVPAQNIIPMPENLTFEEAASVPLTFLTAWHMLVALARLQPGESVLVQAGGSGVGSAAIQIAKLIGARVIATAGSDPKLERSKRLGADEGINYAASDFRAEVMKLTHDSGVEVVFEHIGDKVFQESLRCLTAGGRLVTCGATAGSPVPLDLRYLYARQLSVLGSYMGTKGELLALIPFFQQGKLRPVVHKTLPLKEAREAHQIMMNRDNFGKIVLSV